MADANHQHAELRPGAALERRNSLVFRVTFASGPQGQGNLSAYLGDPEARRAVSVAEAATTQPPPSHRDASGGSAAAPGGSVLAFGHPAQ